MSRITDAVVWVAHPKVMFQPLGGLRVLERQVWGLARAGVRRVWVAAQEPKGGASLRLPPGLELFWVPRESDPPVECRPPYISLSGDHFIRHEALLDIVERDHVEHVSFQDQDRHGVVQVVPFRGERMIQYKREFLPSGATISVQHARGLRPALDWLLEGARKSHDGLMARLFDRRISLSATRWLLGTPIRPNHMTVFSTLVGLAGCFLLLQPGHAADIAGALLVWLHSVLDGCDGEIARIKYQESRFGGILDFWGDNLVHVALFGALGVSRYRYHGGEPLWLLLGAVAATASLASAWLAFRSSFRPASDGPAFKGLSGLPVPTGPAATLKQLEDFLAQRDFIYLLVVCAVLGREDLFLWAGAIGAPLFLLVLVYLISSAPAAPTPVSAVQR